MKALVVEQFGPVDSHRIQEVRDPELKPDTVLVDVKAMGLNYPDLLMLQGKYQTRPETPFVPGRDAAGEVAQSDSSSFKPGDRVMVQVATGAFAQKILAPVERCYPMAKGMGFVEAASMVTPYNTAYVAVVFRSQLKPGERVLVTGASAGVGLAITEIAKAKGAYVIAAVSKDKADVALKHGADATVDSRAANLKDSLRSQVYELTAGKGVDIVFDVVGGEVFDAALRTLAFAGRMVVIGFASGSIPAAKCNYILLKNLSVIGAPLDIHFKERPQWMREATADLARMYDAKEIRPEVQATYPLGEFVKAARLIEEHKLKGRVVLTP